MNVETNNADRETWLTELARRLRTNTAGAAAGDEDLAAWLEGTLDETRTREMEARLVADDDLRRTLFEARQILAEMDEQPRRMPDRLRRRLLAEFGGQDSIPLVRLAYDIARKVLELTTPEGALQPLPAAAVRGDGHAPAYRIVMGEIDVEVGIQTPSPGAFEVSLRLPRSRVEGKRCEWQLLEDERLIELQPSSHGEALFSDVGPGRYRCVLSADGVELGGVEIRLPPEDS